MQFYKIYFESNRPVSIQLLEEAEENRVEIINRDGKKMINAITIYGDDETDCLNVADEVARNLICFL